MPRLQNGERLWIWKQEKHLPMKNIKIVYSTIWLFFTLEWKYSFDFYYEIADALSYMKRQNIKNMRNWIALFSVPLVMYSDLLLSHHGVVPGRVTSNNRMLTARRKYIKYIVKSDSLDYEAVKKQLMWTNIIICTILERVTIGGKSLQHWFLENTV